jgi:hypothetical protein
MVIPWTSADFASLETLTADNESDSSPAVSNFNTPSSTFSQSSSLTLDTNLYQSPGAVRDRNTTLLKYQEAVKELEHALKGAGEVWGNFKTTKFSGNASQTDTILELQNRINETLDAQDTARTNPEGWEKAKQVMKTVFIATSPFAKVFLMVAKQHSLVLFSLLKYSDINIATKSL